MDPAETRSTTTSAITRGFEVALFHFPRSVHTVSHSACGERSACRPGSARARLSRVNPPNGATGPRRCGRNAAIRRPSGTFGSRRARLKCPNVSAAIVRRLDCRALRFAAEDENSASRTGGGAHVDDPHSARLRARDLQPDRCKGRSYSRHLHACAAYLA